MDCSGCEARREWIKKQAAETNRRFKLAMQRLAGDDDRASKTNESNDKPK